MKTMCGIRLHNINLLFLTCFDSLEVFKMDSSIRNVMFKFILKIDTIIRRTCEKISINIGYALQC